MRINSPPDNLPTLLAVARGDAPADLVLTNARIINVFSGEIEEADIAIAGDRIAGIGRGYAADETRDLHGAYVAPGLIDAHVHIESSLCTPANFAQAVVPRGVTTVIADPHEIANVAGAAGVRFMHESSKRLPLRVVLMAPSCVPATDLATSGATLGADDLEAMLREGIFHGLAEMMNFPGVIHGDSEVLAKLRAFEHRPRDGHAPEVRGNQLNAYVASGIGSDHECVSVEEAREKLARGMYIFIREATNARNLDVLVKLVTAANSRRICFCTDDRTPVDLLRKGSIDEMLRRAIASGLDPVTAIRCCTLNAAECFHLNDRGAIAPGRLADLMVFDDLTVPAARMVYAGGRPVEGANWSDETNPVHLAAPEEVLNTVRLPPSLWDCSVPARGNRMRVIGVQPDQLLTDELILQPHVENNYAVSDPDRDLLKMMVIERHRGTGRVGIGFVKGFGLKRGAIAGTFAHDHHNIVTIGRHDAPMLAAAIKLATWGGGLCVVDRLDEVIAALPLPIAGLMTDRPIAEVAAMYEQLLAAARSLGSALADPFMAMSFMALEVIPKLKLTDRGVVDVEQFRVVDLFV